MKEGNAVMSAKTKQITPEVLEEAIYRDCEILS